MKHLFLLVLILSSVWGFSQNDTITYNKSQSLSEKKVPEVFKDTVKVGILAKPDSTETYQDIEKLVKIDSTLLATIFAKGAYDTIYKDITNLAYQEIEEVNLSTDTLKARLAELNQRTPFNVEYNPSLESVIKMFLKNRRKHFLKMIARAKFYFPMFEETLDRYDIPLEMKYLAIVESALEPTARSRVGATGLWQFMYATGKIYDLNVSSFVDERKDPIRATEAACQYLKKLYEMYGDWDLALAAYNSGPGNVNKAIRRSGGHTNYWNIRSFLPRETAGYVPAFQATMYIMEYAEAHDFENISSSKERYYFETDTIQVKKTITFEQIEEHLKIDYEHIKLFNPSYKLDIIPYIAGKNYTLRLPVEAIGRFVANEEAIYAIVEEELDAREKPLPKLVNTPASIRYKVRSGDYLGKIAIRYGVRVTDIRRWNSLHNNTIRAGQRLTIYPRR